jgi:sortase A
MSSKIFKRANNILIILIILVNGYVITTPFFPRLLFMVHSHQGQAVKLKEAVHKPPAASAPAQPNHVIIPSMLLDQPVNEGTDAYAELDKGVWRWPGGSTPDKGGNTVLLGHRFTYTTPKGVFYFLDKATVGSEIGLVWDNKLYTYKVASTAVVPPTDVSILAPSVEPTLTLYTCTPLWNPKSRLVITATLETTK